MRAVTTSSFITKYEKPFRPQRRDKKDIKCINLKGHLARECRNKPKGKETKADNSSKDSSQEGRDKSKVEAAFVAQDGFKECDPSTWYIDSRATAHMTPYQELLEDYRDFDHPMACSMGNGSAIYAKGHGKFHFKHMSEYGVLKVVHWVPDLMFILFSVDSAVKNGAEVLFKCNPEEVHVMKKGWTLLLGKKMDKLYQFKLLPAIGRENTVNLEQEGSLTLMHTEDTWHRRFAHMGGRSLRKLAADRAVVGLRMTNKRMGDCKPCALGKVSRAPHPPRR